jgi:N-acetylmuramoyl-L-alanine amidase
MGVLLLSSFVFAQDKSFRIQYLYIDQIKYVSVSDLVKIYGGELDWNYIQKKAYWEVNEHQVTLALFSPYIILDGKTYNLGYEVKFKKGAIYVPLKNFYPLLQKIKAEETKLEEENQSALPVQESEVTELRASRKLNGVLIEIFISQPLTYEIFLPGNNWLNINFYQTQIDTDFFSGLKIPGLVKDVKAFQFENSAQLSVLLSKSYDTFSHFLISDPCRIQISMEDTSSQFTPSHIEMIDQRTDPIDVVIIDPGHGGDDWGHVGPEGLKEKEVVLDVARRLKSLFSQNHDLKIFLTRESDLTVALEQRARFANERGGDIFLSLHTNFSQDPMEAGFEIFIQGEGKTNKDSIAQFSEDNPSNLNSISKNEEVLSYQDTLPMDSTQVKFAKESEDLALTVQEKLKKILPTQERGMSQADFLVLRKAYMPGIVVQMAYISSPYEELLLQEEVFRQWVAQALYQAILRFRESSPESL